MPITIPESLPAYTVLKNEGVMVMTQAQAERQDIRPLEIALVNLMPKKISTETQFARLIGATPLQINLTLIRMTEHVPKNTPAAHMTAFYKPFRKAEKEKFDGIIITGAPVEHLPYEEVSYWDEICALFEWTETNVHSTIGVCWGGMAMLHYFHGLEKYLLEHKAFGCFPHQNLCSSSRYLRGFSDECLIPVSRWTELRQKEIEDAAQLRILLGSNQTGPCLVQDKSRNALYIFNHFEYDSETLAEEYERDLRKETPISIPRNYFPNNDVCKSPLNRWRSHGHLFYGNWINEIYQSTPYELSRIGEEQA